MNNLFFRFDEAIFLISCIDGRYSLKCFQLEPASIALNGILGYVDDDGRTFANAEVGVLGGATAETAIVVDGFPMGSGGYQGYNPIAPNAGPGSIGYNTVGFGGYQGYNPIAPNAGPGSIGYHAVGFGGYQGYNPIAPNAGPGSIGYNTGGLGGARAGAAARQGYNPIAPNVGQGSIGYNVDPLICPVNAVWHVEFVIHNPPRHIRSTLAALMTQRGVHGSIKRQKMGTKVRCIVVVPEFARDNMDAFRRDWYKIAPSAKVEDKAYTEYVKPLTLKTDAELVRMAYDPVKVTKLSRGAQSNLRQLGGTSNVSSDPEGDENVEVVSSASTQSSANEPVV